MMAATYKDNKRGQSVRLSIQDLPTPPFSKWNQGDILPYQFAAYFRQLLQNPRYKNVETLILPSPMELTGTFGCSETTVFRGFQELQRQGYDYKIQGLDFPILFSDPRNRSRQNTNNWGTLSQELLKPWDMVRNRTRNPLDTHPYMPKL